MKPDSGLDENSNKAEAITNRPDDWLLREWKAGNEQAAEVFANRYTIRLVALVANRLNRRYRSSVDPEEVVHSALGSFFNAARHSRIEVSGSVSLWRLLATFVRRKMARSIERQSAAKRGGDYERLSLDDVGRLAIVEDATTSEDEVSEVVALVKAELPEELFAIVEGLLAGQTQRELANSLGIDERTVRRRLSRVREHLGFTAPDAGMNAHAASSPPKLPRVEYNDFVLGKLIGSGGFGKVYRAGMQTSGETVAVKFLRKAFWQNQDARRSFLREIDLASQIDHPGVIRYLGYGESPHGGPYLLSEWIDGQSIDAISGPTIEQFRGWLLQICQALDAVHQAGLVHGDLTPTNILVDRDNRITITDFGFSQATVPEATSILGGTLGFAAPEQIDSSFGTVSPKTDIYAVGGLVHWFIYRTPPNAGRHLGEIVEKTLANRKEDALRFAECPATFRAILAATLNPSPVERIESVSKLIRLLS
ncbi:protein kinase domain-containing protein [Allorhodopirellula heiligendammensis]|uniref:Serine/threonine-protein kinase PknH n=1 Tax=Allorhodopirellula heiligendammensis TaxID=2714739 RepID=A0A5C6C5Z7_9BACT|nr:protein kinase [Allorhodopirellula heiligendammensis]TWU18866.1 Serine/threonine-protein kinase PknH [Allorhodopirellula heiligendammensis]